MSLIIVLAFSILLFGVTLASLKTKETDEEAVFLDRETCSILKGFAILLVFVHHYGQLASDIYNAHSFLGYIGVTIFLFITGYASEKQFLKIGKNYVGFSFIKKKIMRLYIPYILIILLYAILGQHGFRNTISELLHIEKDWFLTAVTIFYIMFMVANLLAPKNAGGGYGLCLLTGLMFVYVAVCIFLKLDTAAWFNTAFAFLIGCCWAYIEIRGIFIEHKTILLYITIPLTTLFVFLSVQRFHYYATSTLASLFFSFVIIFLFGKLRVRNRVLAIVGHLSWEFYLCQSRNLMIAKNYFGGNVVVWFLVALAASIAVAVVINRLCGLVGIRRK